MYRLEVHHTTHWDGIPVEEIERRKTDALALPWWKQLFSGSKTGGFKTLEHRVEAVDGEFDTLDDADDAAVALAAELTGVIRDDSAVVIIREEDEELVDGIYPNDGGRF